MSVKMNQYWCIRCLSCYNNTSIQDDNNIPENCPYCKAAWKYPKEGIEIKGNYEKFHIKNEEEDRMLKWFSYSHLPGNLQDMAGVFRRVAELICAECTAGPERTVALRKLLEAKDATIRSKVYPGG